MRSMILFTLCCGWTLPAEVVGSIRVTAGNAGQIEMVAHRTIRAQDGSKLEKASKEVTLDTAVSGHTQRVAVRFPGCDCGELSANLRFKTMNGDAFTDFPTTMTTNEPPEKDARGGRHVYRGARWFGARVGNGGPEHKLEALNGTIEIRQKGQ
jgi:hypothetical protein